MPLGQGIAAYRAVSDRLADLRGTPIKGIVCQTDLYAANNGIGGISSDEASQISDAVSFMFSLGKDRISPLSKFCSDFESRYGDSSVALLEVLDPTLGIGYPSARTSRPSLISRLGLDPAPGRATDRESLAWLSNALLARTEDNYIRVDKVGPKTLQNTMQNGPDQVMAWVSPWRAQDGSTILELKTLTNQRHGRLMGRFADGLPDVRDFLQTSNRNRETAAAIVAEIVHLPQGHLGNISTRPRLTEWEVCIRAGASPAAKRIALEDIYVSVRNGRVLLHSQRHSKRLLLQMSNAHRYSAPEGLGIYAFLNAVADQDSDRLPLVLQSAYPTADFLPGLIYKGMIVSRPTWRFNREVAKALLGTVTNGDLNGIGEWRNRHALPRWVSLVDSDHVMPFDLESLAMAKLFLVEASRQARFEVRDSFALGNGVRSRMRWKSSRDRNTGPALNKWQPQRLVNR